MMALLLLLLGLSRAEPLEMVPPVPDPGVPDFPVPSLYQLRNGTPVWLVERHDLPLVRIELSLRGGLVRASDPLALQFAGVLLDDGTGRRGGADWQGALADLGARYALGAGNFRAWADVEAVKGTEAEALSLLAEAVREPAFPRSEVRRVRASWVRSGENAWRSADTITALALTRAVLPPEHPLGRIWTPEDYRQLDRSRARKAWREVISSSAPALVVAGDIRPDEILPLLEQELGWLPGSQHSPVLEPPPPAGPRLILVDHPGVELVRVVTSLPAPPAFAPEMPALDVITQALCGAFTSRLNMRLREEEGWTYGVDCQLRAWPGFSRLTIEVPVAPEHLGPTVGVLRESLLQAARDLPLPAELRAGRNTLLLDAARDLQSLARIAWRLGARLSHDRPPDEEQQVLEATASLDLEATRTVARSLLSTPDVLTLVIGDRATIEPLLEEAGLVPDAIWSGRQLVRDR